jgi:hypothetical protein
MGLDRAMTKRRQKFLVAFDYGQGGVWGFVLASSKEDIWRRFPRLQIVDSRPPWMTDEFADRLSVDDIDGPYRGVLADIETELSRTDIPKPQSSDAHDDVC